MEPRTDMTDGIKGATQPLLPSPSASPCELGKNSSSSKEASTTKSPKEPHESLSAMANFVVDPTPPLVFLEDGGPHRQARQVVYITGRASKTHVDCVIVVVNEELTAEQRHQLMHNISQYIVQEVQLQVCFFALHPHGVRIFSLRKCSS
jgi:hypothetical protein